MRRLALALAVALSASGALAQEAKRPLGVVELFTSQGCSSCPPADRFFGDLARAGNVIALAYHVDYWDYLGWRDTLASPDNTARQNDYREAFAARSVYTPQAVINGREHVNGADRAAVLRTIEAMAADGKGLNVGISVRRTADRLVIEVGAAREPVGEAMVVLVSFRPASVVAIDRGENSGSTLTYWNAVSSVRTAGMWNGEPARFELPIKEVSRKGSGGCAVLLQAMAAGGLPGPILGAALLDRP
ncbi:MAG: thioredoxin family protein [Rhizobiaceae bacterium]|nr:thioredoxin family protein [Rhizobiaceae bacterium]